MLNRLTLTNSRPSRFLKLNAQIAIPRRAFRSKPSRTTIFLIRLDEESETDCVTRPAPAKALEPGFPYLVVIHSYSYIGLFRAIAADGAAQSQTRNESGLDGYRGF